jgi:hypothetical protein
MATFTDPEQLKDLATYKKTLAKAMGKVGQSSSTKFQCRKDFVLGDGTKKTIVLVDADATLLKGFAKNGTMEAEGTCTENTGKQPVFTVTKGKSSALKTALKDGGQADAVVGVDMDQVTANLSKSNVEEDREKLNAQGAVAASKVSPGDGKLSTAAELAKHLKDSGRSQGEPTTPIKNVKDLQQHIKDSGGPDQAKREAASGKILGMMEKNTNERRHDPSNTMHDAADAHAVSGHGSGTDQVPRLVSGRRADEVAQETADGLTPKTTKPLTGNKHGLADRTIPEYSTVGTDASSTSSAFASNVAMLHAIEDALAQASQVEAFYAKKPDQKPEKVKELEKNLEKARADLQLLKTQDQSDTTVIAKTVELKKEVTDLNKQLAFAMRQALDTSSSYVGKKTGTTTPGKEFLPDGMGSGIEIDDPSKVAKLGDSGSALTEDTMKKRFASIKDSGTKDSAKVVLDPAFVTDEKTGAVRRAGFDVHTAFPSDKGMQKPISKPDDVDQQKVEVEKVAELEGKLKQAKAKLDQAQKATKKAQSSIDAVKKNEANIKNGIVKSKERETKLVDQESKAATDPSIDLKNVQAELAKVRDTIVKAQERLDGIPELEKEKLKKAQEELEEQNNVSKAQLAYDNAVNQLRSASV